MRASEGIERRLAILQNHVRELYRFTVADAYFFVMLRWALDFGVPVTPELVAYYQRVAERPAVRQALAEEGLDLPRGSLIQVIPVEGMVVT